MKLNKENSSTLARFEISFYPLLIVNDKLISTDIHSYWTYSSVVPIAHIATKQISILKGLTQNHFSCQSPHSVAI